MRLVPVFSFGETEIFDNPRLPIWLQQLVVSFFRSNVLFCPYGVLNLPGVPRGIQLTIVVAESLDVPPVANPSKRQIELVRPLHSHGCLSLVS